MQGNFVNEVEAALKAAGYCCTEEIAAQVALLLAQNGGSVKAMLLGGPPGSGKTFLAKSVAKILGVPYIYIQAHPGSSPEDFLYDANIVQILRGVAGDSSAVKSAEDVVDLGFLPMIFKESQKGPVVAFVDELDKASPKTDSLFLAALQEGEVVVKGIGRIKANLKNLILFFTKNNEREISEPLMRRCRRDYLGFPDATLELAILTGKIHSFGGLETVKIPEEGMPILPEPLAKVLVSMAGQFRSRQEDLIKSPATQELMLAGQDVLHLAQWHAIGLAGQIVFGWLAAYQEDREILRQITTPEKLQELLVAVVKSSSQHEKCSQEVKECDDGFVSI